MRLPLTFMFASVLTFTLTAGCSSPTGPTGQTGPTATPAKLVLSDLSVTLTGEPSSWAYWPKFRIAETSGTGAVIKAVRVTAPAGLAPFDNVYEETGELCWSGVSARDPMPPFRVIRVEGGGILDAFAIDAQAPGLGYCSPSYSSRGELPLPSVVVTVLFEDDLGIKGEIVVSIPVR